MEKLPNDRAHPLRRVPTHRYRQPERVTAHTSTDVVRTAEQEAATQIAEDSLLQSVSEKLRLHQPIKPAAPRMTRSFVLRRETVERHAKEHRRKVRKNYGWHVVGILIGLMVACSLGIIIWSFRDMLPFKLDFWNRGQSASQQTVQLSPPTSLSSLDETLISSADIIGHKMASDEPRSISIPKLDVQARILRMGISLDNEPIAPNNIHDVGWFEASGKPGSSGAVLLNGNSRGPTQPGVFANLKTLVPGDVIVMERGNGSRLTYIVHKVQEYPGNQVDMTTALQSIEPGKQGLNLMTTPSKYNAVENSAAKRQVVFAVLQSN